MMMLTCEQWPEFVKRRIVNQFTNIQALEAWLGKYGIKYEAWGANSSKSLRNLWQELEAGEVQLKDNPPLRVVDVVQLIILRDDHILVEAAQEFITGQRRFRNQPPSEKIKPGENIQQAAYRCLLEELDVPSQRITLHLETHRQRQTKTNSISYPGLPSLYNFHMVEACIADLPQEDFWRENRAGGVLDPIKRHLWAWRPLESIKSIPDS